MKLPDLPSEILLTIIDLVCPDDLVNVVLSCHRVYEVANKRLATHKDYIKRYSRVKIDDHVQSWYRATYVIKHACVLLYDIQEDDNVKYYVRNLEFSPGHEALLYNRDDDVNVKKLRSLDLDSMLSPWLKDADQRKHFKDIILREFPPVPGFNGAEEGGAAFVLLLSMLPNLKGIELLSSLFKFSNHLQEFLAATKAWTDDGQGGFKPLQKVEYVNVEHWDTEGSEQLAGIGDLIYLPNLKELSGLSLEHGYWNDELEPALSECSLHRGSTITKVMLVHSLISPSSLFRFIRPMNNLRYLEYEHGGVVLGEAAPEDFDIEEYKKEFVHLAHDWLEERGLVSIAIKAEDEDDYGEGCALQIHRKDKIGINDDHP